jgi:hypothetical protein
MRAQARYPRLSFAAIGKVVDAECVGVAVISTVLIRSPCRPCRRHPGAWTVPSSPAARLLVSALAWVTTAAALADAAALRPQLHEP